MEINVYAVHIDEHDSHTHEQFAGVLVLPIASLNLKLFQ
jgi:hypothetical protein